MIDTNTDETKDNPKATTLWDRPKRRFVSTNRTEGVVKLRLSPREMKD